ncbi:MAG: hypothetical protein ACHQ6T_06140 [Myxococcota bacterium]
MKTRKSLFLILAAGTLALSATAYADDSTTSPVDPGHPRVTEVQKRQQNQERRIENGEKNGSVTPAEAKRLDRRQGKIEKQKEADMAAHNGHLTKPEQRQLNREENHASHQIHRLKHNDKTTTPPAAPAPATAPK